MVVRMARNGAETQAQDGLRVSREKAPDVEREETAAPAYFSSRIASYFSYTCSEERLSVMPYVLLILYVAR
jgi:hypothetical protein